MGILTRKEKTDQAEAIEEKAYQEERLKQAKDVGVARAKAEARERKKAPIEAKAEAKSGKFAKFCTKIVKFMQSDKVQGFADNLSGSFDESMGGPKEKPKKKKEEKEGEEEKAGLFYIILMFSLFLGLLFWKVVLK